MNTIKFPFRCFSFYCFRESIKIEYFVPDKLNVNKYNWKNLLDIPRKFVSVYVST